MNFQDYERKFYLLYEEFAEIVKLILEKAIEASDVPRPQSVQCRAKSLKRLKERLEESGKLNSENIENERRDLAGARAIFYTNTDVDRFLNSRLIVENFGRRSRSSAQLTAQIKITHNRASDHKAGNE